MNNCRDIIAKLLKLSIVEEEEDELAYDADPKKHVDAAANKSSKLSRAGKFFEYIYNL